MKVQRQGKAGGRSGMGAQMDTDLHAIAGVSAAIYAIWHVECFDADGNLKWSDENKNLIVNTGLDDILDKYYKGSGYSAAFFVGLTDGTPTVAATDTMSTHAGWVEVTDYSQGTRPALTLGTVSAQSVDNSASKATFSITGSTTVGGAFLSTNSTKGGTSGILHSAVAFGGGDRTVANGDTMNVTVTLTMANAA